mgnify:CR=1 FL=1
MRDQELIQALREHAEWARANEWETPITLGDDLVAAADRLANQNTHIAALQQEIEKLRGRLKAYEDTGLTPEEVKKIGMRIEAGCVKAIAWTCGVDINRLRKLAEDDKEGRLVVLPCKAGDTVYEVTSRKTISEYRVKAIRVELFCTFIEWDIVAGFVDKSIFGVPADEIGKTVFLTREEAGKALEEMKDE